MSRIKYTIFPKGSRGFYDENTLPFKPGAVPPASEANFPVLPVTIRGANKVWSQDLKFPRLAKVEIFFHPAFEIPKNIENLDEQIFAQKITDELKQVIEKKL